MSYDAKKILTKTKQSKGKVLVSLNDTTSLILEFTEDNIEDNIVGAVEECESSVCANPVAGSSRDLIYDESTFAPEIVRPYPKAAVRTKITRKTRKSAILTDTPEKEALTVEQSKKKENTSKKIKVTKKGKAENTNKRGESAKKKRKISVKRKVLQKSDKDSLEDDHFCLICCESFDQSRAGKKWVQCIVCKKWSHVKYAKGNILSYVCLNCDSDYSD
ncbi:uncharacterized protein LOC120358101 [Solenopsis invicta]|uniref:uncharacterized protein LOC120358101 n=1 Tax=Solenopsis invicta TaxID=13686 RepID=UPI00193D9062|nr:uncharacterized protein LOC120358101 [Solenopsis invicta]